MYAYIYKYIQREKEKKRDINSLNQFRRCLNDKNMALKELQFHI